MLHLLEIVLEVGRVDLGDLGMFLLGCRFFICEMGMMVVSLLQGSCEVYICYVLGAH